MIRLPATLHLAILLSRAMPSLAGTPRTQPEPTRAAIHVTGMPLAEADPFAALTAWPTRARAGTPVRLDATGSSDLGGSLLLARFDFEDDGTFDTGWGPLRTTHAYPVPGEHVARVEVRTLAGATASTTLRLEATDEDQPPVLLADLLPARSFGTATPSLAVDLGRSHDPEGGPLVFEVAFGTGPAVSGSATRFEATVAVSRSESVPVAVTARDQAGRTTSLSRVIRVVSYDRPPAARLVLLPGDTSGEWVLDASQSTDPDHGESWDGYLAYRYDFEGDGYFDTPFQEGASSVPHPYEAGRTYRPAVEVRDRLLAVSRATSLLDLRSPPRFPAGVGLVATANECGIDLTWSPAGTGSLPPTYSVYRTALDIRDGTWELLARVAGRRYLDSRAKPGRLYGYLVRARAAGEPVLEDSNLDSAAAEAPARGGTLLLAVKGEAGGIEARWEGAGEAVVLASSRPGELEEAIGLGAGRAHLAPEPATLYFRVQPTGCR